jgi:hypothetical protein
VVNNCRSTFFTCVFQRDTLALVLGFVANTLMTEASSLSRHANFQSLEPSCFSHPMDGFSSCALVNFVKYIMV